MEDEGLLCNKSIFNVAVIWANDQPRHVEVTFEVDSTENWTVKPFARVSQMNIYSVPNVAPVSFNASSGIIFKMRSFPLALILAAFMAVPVSTSINMAFTL